MYYEISRLMKEINSVYYNQYMITNFYKDNFINNSEDSQKMILYVPQTDISFIAQDPGRNHRSFFLGTLPNLTLLVPLREKLETIPCTALYEKTCYKSI